MALTNIAHNVYKANGCRDRTDYLENLADDYGVSLEMVLGIAEVLGPNEDFDGLVNEVQDLSEGYGE